MTASALKQKLAPMELLPVPSPSAPLFPTLLPHLTTSSVFPSVAKQQVLVAASRVAMPTEHLWSQQQRITYVIVRSRIFVTARIRRIAEFFLQVILAYG